MKALVTGGAGFIGSHLCEALLERGDKVICYDNLSTGKTINISHLRKNKKFKFIHGDVRDRKVLDFSMKGVDVVFNQMAAKKTVCERSPVEDCEINAGGTLNVLLSMVDNGVNKIVHASTGSVYGEVGGMITEFTPLNPVSYYGVSKMAGEKYVAAFGDLHGIEYTILRYFHVYGEKQDSSDHGGVIPIFLRKVVSGEPILIHGDGEQVRSFTYVGDVVHANIVACEKMDNRIYNCASGIKVSINELAKMVHERTYDSGLVYGDEMFGDVRNFNIDNSLIKEDFLMEFTNFADGLDKTVEWYAAL